MPVFNGSSLKLETNNTEGVFSLCLSCSPLLTCFCGNNTRHHYEFVRRSAHNGCRHVHRPQTNSAVVQVSWTGPILSDRWCVLLLSSNFDPWMFYAALHSLYLSLFGHIKIIICDVNASVTYFTNIFSSHVVHYPLLKYLTLQGGCPLHVFLSTVLLSVFGKWCRPY